MPEDICIIVWIVIVTNNSNNCLYSLLSFGVFLNYHPDPRLFSPLGRQCKKNKSADLSSLYSALLVTALLAWKYYESWVKAVMVVLFASQCLSTSSNFLGNHYQWISGRHVLPHSWPHFKHTIAMDNLDISWKGRGKEDRETEQLLQVYVWSLYVKVKGWSCSPYIQCSRPTKRGGEGC